MIVRLPPNVLAYCHGLRQALPWSPKHFAAIAVSSMFWFQQHRCKPSFQCTNELPAYGYPGLESTRTRLRSVFFPNRYELVASLASNSVPPNVLADRHQAQFVLKDNTAAQRKTGATRLPTRRFAKQSLSHQAYRRWVQHYSTADAAATNPIATPKSAARSRLQYRGESAFCRGYLPHTRTPDRLESTIRNQRLPSSSSLRASTYLQAKHRLEASYRPTAQRGRANIVGFP